MKKVYYVLIILITVVLLYILTLFLKDPVRVETTPVQTLSNKPISEAVFGATGQVTINKLVVVVEVATSSADQALGLAKRADLPLNHGMLFVFSEMARQAFWMKDMLLPLDMIFMDNNWRVVLIESNVLPSSFPQAFGVNVNSQYVLEIPAGQALSAGLQVGDIAIFVNK